MLYPDAYSGSLGWFGIGFLQWEVALILLAVALFVLELTTPPPIGPLFGTGCLALLLGGILFFSHPADPATAGFMLPIVGIAIALALVVVFVMARLLPFLQNLPKTDSNPLSQKLIGQTGRVVVALQPGKLGKVKVYGEIWDAHADTALAHDEPVRVTSLDLHNPRVVRVEKVTE